MQSRAISYSHTCTTSYNVNVSVVEIQIDTNSLMLFFVVYLFAEGAVRAPVPG